MSPHPNPPPPPPPLPRLPLDQEGLSSGHHLLALCMLCPHSQDLNSRFYFPTCHNLRQHLWKAELLVQQGLWCTQPAARQQKRARRSLTRAGQNCSGV